MMDARRNIAKATVLTFLLSSTFAHATTIMSDTRALASTLPPNYCRSGKYFGLPSGCYRSEYRGYAFTCGNVMQQVWRDSSLFYPIQGKFYYTLPNGQGGCYQVSELWHGLDHPGGPDAADAIRHWRSATCSATGFREGKGGRVVWCGGAIPGDTLGDVE